MFKNDLLKNYPDIDIIGFIDKSKNGNDIFKVDTIKSLEFDYILILSQNHFNSIYQDYSKIIRKTKLIKVLLKNDIYFFQNSRQIWLEKFKNTPNFFKEIFLKFFVYLFDTFSIPRTKILFLSKSFIGTNNKMLYVTSLEKGLNCIMLSDNNIQLKELNSHNIPCINFNSLRAYYHLASAKIVIQDQGNSNSLLKFLSPNQKTLQLWHGVPLKRMNRLTDVTYDYFTSTSKYVNETSLNTVIPSKQQFETGYPRNDLLLKKNHTQLDLLFYDKECYEIAKENKTIVYMPTHRESASSVNNKSNDLIPLDFAKLNQKMTMLNTYFIIKLHPFVMQFYEDIKNSKAYSNIFFHSIQGDIYPLLKYTDILITDYSSVYFDFLLLNKPIIFFNYDYEEYSSNMNGFVYDYKKNAPGMKVKTQALLENEIEKSLADKDAFKKDRKEILSKFFTYHDEFSSHRVLKVLQ